MKKNKLKINDIVCVTVPFGHYPEYKYSVGYIISIGNGNIYDIYMFDDQRMICVYKEYITKIEIK